MLAGSNRLKQEGCMANNWCVHKWKESQMMPSEAERLCLIWRRRRTMRFTVSSALGSISFETTDHQQFLKQTEQFKTRKVFRMKVIQNLVKVKVSTLTKSFKMISKQLRRSLMFSRKPARFRNQTCEEENS